MAHQIFIQGFGMADSWINEGRWLLVAMGVSTLALEIWMVTEALMGWKKAKDADISVAE